jgi:spoIIIJ-associated protein
MSDSEHTQPIDVTGPTLEEAIEEGLSQLGLTRTEVIIEIIEEGGKGMLGLGGAREALVRLTPLRPPQPSTLRPAPDEDDGEEDARIGLEILEELLSYMQIEATIDTYRAEPSEADEDTPWILDIKGPDLGILIGRRGETLDALQYVTRLIISRELQRRETTLRRLAERMAAQARKLGRTMTLEPMPPNERRIIHIALRDDDTVTTESVGVGDRRKVTIIPVGGQYR